MNYQLFQAINDLAGRLDPLDDAMEFAATWLLFGIFATAAVIMAVAIRRGDRSRVVDAAVALAVAFASAQALSHLNGQLRPFQTHHVHQLIAHGNGVSLPSDHATAAFTVALAVAVFLHRRWGIALLAAAAAVGLARIWVGVHYPGDILAGLAIAVLAVTSVVIVNRFRTGTKTLTLKGTA
jgi:undecaprenyl-diphosphatase